MNQSTEDSLATIRDFITAYVNAKHRTLTEKERQRKLRAYMDGTYGIDYTNTKAAEVIQAAADRENHVLVEDLLKEPKTNRVVVKFDEYYYGGKFKIVQMKGCTVIVVESSTNGIDKPEELPTEPQAKKPIHDPEEDEEDIDEDESDDDF